MNDDDDVAAAAERARRTVDRATWVAIGLGLAFTAVNVQLFAAAGAPAGSLGWVVAWTLDPMVSILLLAVVRAEQVTARWQITMGWQVSAVKWAAFAATYAMNTWSSWRDGSPSGVVLHSVPPVFVLLAAEVAPALRDRLTEAVRIASTAAEDEGCTVCSPVGVVREVPPPSDEVASTSLVASEQGADVPDPTPAPPAADTNPQLNELNRSEGGAGATDSTDPQVREIAELLAAGCEVTGPQVAALHGVSDRTGRRRLADARTHLEQHPIRPDLHLVGVQTAGGTA